MPAIKLKKKTQEYLAEKKREKEAQEAAAEAAATPSTPPSPPKKKKEARPPQAPPAYLNENDILFEKRKRTIPVVEQKCQDWIMDNFEKKEDVHVNTNKMYEYYTDTMLENSENVADLSLFQKIIRDKLGKFFGVKEISPLHGVLKELKFKEKKIQGETLGLKIKDILNEVITGVGNPNKGIRFISLKQLVGSKYPALQLETHPHKLLSALERGMRFGNIILVKGTGKCGRYRVPGESTAEEDKPKPKVKKIKEEIVDDENPEENGETSENAEGTEEVKKQKPKGKKKSGKAAKKSAGDEEATEGEDKEEPKKRGKKRKSEEMEDKGNDSAEAEGDNKKKQKKKGKKAKPRHTSRMFFSEAEKHGNPSKIQDVFPMALTFMSDPKEASIIKISKYIEKYYAGVDTGTKLKEALDQGVEEDMWQSVGGKTYRLLLTEFSPGYSNDYEDMISQAIMASHEPKTASGLMIKKYILQYHENFSIDKRPHLFKRALESALSKNIIRQVSGLGSGGSFQLVKPFVPSPAILAGETDDKAEFLDFDPVDDEKDEVYIVRKTKSGRGGGGGTKTAVKERKPPASRK